MQALSRPLQAYVACAIIASLPALALGIVAPRALVSEDLAPAVVLFGLAWLAWRFPVHVGPKLKVPVEDAATFAAALILPPFVAMSLAGGSAVLGVRFNGKIPLFNRLFNASAALLSTGAAAGTFALLAGGIVDDHIGAVAAAALAGYVVRTEIVDGAIALQLRRPLFASWWLDHRRDIAQIASLYALGALGALTAQANPWAIFLLAVPVALVFVSFRETVRLRSQTRSAILRLADLIDARDAYTFGHSLRVSQSAEGIARRLSMAPAQIELVREAARLHDVRKITTGDRILQKPGPLTEAEAAEMHRHAEAGYEFLKQLPEFWEGAALVRSHHERFDGGGDPRGLTGDAVPLEASIIAVADAWDAMTSDRPYRRALRSEQARAELLRCRGTQWNPLVVDTFLAIPDEERPPETAAVPPPA